MLQGLAQVRRIDMLIMFLGAKHNRGWYEVLTLMIWYIHELFCVYPLYLDITLFDGSLVLCDLFTKLKGSVPDADLGKLAKVYDIKSL